MKQKSSLIRRYIAKYRGLILGGAFSLVIVDILDICLPLILKRGIDGIVEERSFSAAAGAAFIYFGAAAVQALMRFSYRRNLPRAAVYSARDIRNEISRGILEAPLTSLGTKKDGEYVTLAASDADNVTAPFDTGIVMFGDACFYLVLVPPIMFFLAPSLAPLLIAPLLLIPFFVRNGKRRIYSRTRDMQDRLGAMTAVVHESISGIDVIRGEVREPVVADQFEQAARGLRESTVNLIREEAVLAPKLEGMGFISSLVLLTVGGMQVISGTLSLGSFVALQRYIQQMMWPLEALGHYIAISRRARGSADRIEAIAAEGHPKPAEGYPGVAARGHPEPGVVAEGHPKPVAAEGHPGVAGVAKGHPEPAAEIRNLSFLYPGSPEPALDRITLKIARGEKIAVVGNNGSGKSTLLALLSGAYPVASGKIFIFGRDISGCRASDLSQFISVVPQESFLFTGSVRDNLPGTGAEREKVMHVLDSLLLTAELGDDILDLRLSEGGRSVSGGQRQRLCLARALMKDAPLLVMDDPLSAVDGEKERKITDFIRQDLSGGRTCIYTTHRLSLLGIADRIIVLDRGGIIQAGTMAELVADRSGWFSKFREKESLREEIKEFRVEQRNG